MSKDEICPVATTLDLIGGKYKALILWHLADGSHRFSEIRRMVSDATPKMLTQQLRELEAQDLIGNNLYSHQLKVLSYYIAYQ